MLITVDWVFLAVLGAAALLETVFQLVGRLRTWRASMVSKLRWGAAILLFIVAVAVIAFLEYNVRPPVRTGAGDNKKIDSTSAHEQSKTGTEPPTTNTIAEAAVVTNGVRDRDSMSPVTTATETTGVTSEAEEYLRATTGFEKQRPPEIDETLKPNEVSSLIKQTGRGASNWFLFADGPVKVFCISGSDNRITSLLCPKTPCDLNALPLCHHIRVKNEDAKSPVRVRIWYYNPFGQSENRGMPDLPEVAIRAAL